MTSDTKELLNPSVDIYLHKASQKLYAIAESVLQKDDAEGIYLYAVLKIDLKNGKQDISDFLLPKPMEAYESPEELKQAINETPSLFKKFRTELRETAYLETIKKLAKTILDS